MSKRIPPIIATLLLAAATLAFPLGMVRADEEPATVGSPVVVEEPEAEGAGLPEPVAEDGLPAEDEPSDGEGLPAEDAPQDEALPEDGGIGEEASDGVDTSQMTEDELWAYRAEHDLANSFRFQDGQPIASYDEVEPGGLRSRTRATAPAWSYTSNGWVNNRGEIIEGAIAKGIDVSEWQDDIDWEQVKADGITFAILRIGYSTYKDATFERNARECERVGMPYGVYVYSYARNATEAAQEAEAVIRYLRGFNPTYPVYIDIEDLNSQGNLTSSQFASLASAFCNRIEQAGYTPGVYSMLSWWERYFTSSVFDNWSKWIAQYYSVCEYEGDYRIWQCSGTGSVAGISGYVDINFEFGSTPSVGLPPNNASGSYAHPIAVGEYNIISGLSSSKVVDTYNNSTAAGANIQLWDFTNGGGDRFKLSVDSRGLYTIQNVNSGKYLSLYARADLFGQNVIQADASSTLAQKWIIERSGSGYIIRSAYNIDYVLDVSGQSTANGTNIGIWTANGGANQRWTFRPLAYSASRTVENGTYYIAGSSDTGIVLDIAGQSTSTGANVGFWTSNRGTNQQFKITYNGNGYYTIVGMGSGLAVDVSGYSSRTGANLIQWTLGNNKDNQLWAIVRNSDGSYSFVSKLSGLLLTAAGGVAKGSNAETGPMDYAANQRFSLMEVGTSPSAQPDPSRPVADGTYVIESALASGLVLDVDGYSSANGANVQTWQSNGGRNQQWTVTWDSATKHYIIKCVSSGKLLDASGARATAGTNVIQYASNGGLNQRWDIVANGTGYQIRSAMDPNIVVDISGQSKAPGTNVCLWTANGGANQRFNFLSSGSASVTGRVVSDGTYEIALTSNPNLILDVAGESMADRANIGIWTDHNGSNQRFRFTWDADSQAYIITNVKSGCVLDLAGSVARVGANVQQYHAVGWLDQRWIVTKTSSGYLIASAVDPTFYLCLDSGTPKAGSNVQLGSSSSAVTFQIRAV